jgi:hypothetical protein
LSPATIDPATGVVTLINPNFGYNLNDPSGPTDVVSLANALYATTDFPGDLLAIDETTGAHTFLETKLNGNVVPVADMTVSITGGSQVVEPSTGLLILSALAGLIGIGRRRRSGGTRVVIEGPCITGHDGFPHARSHPGRSHGMGSVLIRRGASRAARRAPADAGFGP